MVDPFFQFVKTDAFLGGNRKCFKSLETGQSPWSSIQTEINLVQQENAGASAARNSGMKATTATYVVFLDSDDWVSPDFLKKLLPRVTRRKLDGAFCAAVDVDEHGERGKYWHPVPRQEFFNTTAHDCPIAVHCGLLRRSLILEVGGWDETFDLDSARESMSAGYWA